MKTTARAKCNHPGCGEWGFWQYDSQKASREHAATRSKWTCSRHTNMEKWLKAEQLSRTIILTAQPSEGLDPAKHRFWHDGERLGSGFNYSSCHKAMAEDFPIGTKLIITARIELPEDSELPPKEQP